MVAQNLADFLIFRGHARRRDKGFGALAQYLERTAIPFIKNIYSQLRKKWGKIV